VPVVASHCFVPASVELGDIAVLPELHAMGPMTNSVIASFIKVIHGGRWLIVVTSSLVRDCPRLHGSHRSADNVVNGPDTLVPATVTP
jgi:hypothetical protein